MFYIRLAGGHLYGKQLFTRLSLIVSLMASFVLSFFPLDVLDEIWDFIDSVSEGFLIYSLNVTQIYLFLFYLQVIHISRFGFNQSSPSGDMMKTRHCQHLLTFRNLENEVKVTKI